MQIFNRLALSGLILFAVGCTTDDVHTGEVQAALSDPTLVTDNSAYQPSQNIVATWTGLPGNELDWIAIAPQGSDPTTVTTWVYTNGAVAGTHTFGGLTTTGTYVARAFSNDSYNLIIESSPFTIAASSVTVSTDHSSYTPGQTINASWTGLPGNSTDWIAIAPQGSDVMTVTNWVYTGGATSGSHAFNGLSTNGTYVARAFPNDTFTLLAESAPFTVGGSLSVTISTDSTVYGFGQTVTVTWAGLPGNATDWVALAPDGSAPTTVTRWVYTGGATSGSVGLEAPSTGGAYVARAFPDDTYNIAGESTPFTVGLTLSTDASSYSTTQNITVTWQNLSTNATDWIAIAPAGSSLMTVNEWVYTGGASNGSHVFSPITTSGNYVARAFSNDTYTLLSESAQFAVGTTSGATVMTDLSSYSVGQAITVSWTGLPGNATDWIALAPSGSAPTTTTQWVYTGGATSGSTTFAGGVSTAGSYVARAFVDDTYTMLAESTVFAVN